MRKTILTMTWAAVLLHAGVTLAADPVCGDVNDSGTVSSTDALLVLRKGVGQDISLSCDAYDAQFAACQSDLSAANANLAARETELLSCQADLSVADACGNAAIDAGEDCDFGQMNRGSCASEAFDFGTLTCGAGCRYDTSGCFGGAVVDQMYTDTTGLGGLQITDSQPVTQTFTVGVTGQLVRIDAMRVKQYNCAAAEDLRVKLVTTSGGVPTTTVLATVSFASEDVPPAGGQAAELFVDISAYDVHVTAGDVLGIRLETDASGGAGMCNYAWTGDAPGSYAGGSAFIGNLTTPNLRDMDFRTLVLP